jgi:DNA-binding CsgD family transcriptional regulator
MAGRGFVMPTQPPPSKPTIVFFQTEESEGAFVELPLLPQPYCDQLSPAEQEIVCSMLEGHSNADVAKQRGTSSRTVSNQIATIFKKLNVNSRSELSDLLFNPAHKSKQS